MAAGITRTCSVPKDTVENLRAYFADRKNGTELIALQLIKSRKYTKSAIQLACGFSTYLGKNDFEKMWKRCQFLAKLYLIRKAKIRREWGEKVPLYKRDVSKDEDGNLNETSTEWRTEIDWWVKNDNDLARKYAGWFPPNVRAIHELPWG